MADGNPCQAHGINVVGLRRAGMPPSERRVLQEAYRLLYRSGLAPGRALERIRGELPATPALMRLVDFVAAPSRRGIIPPKGGWRGAAAEDRKSTRLNSSHSQISYAVFCLKKKTENNNRYIQRGSAIAEGILASMQV